MDKQLVTVMRKWHEPFIRIDVTEIGVGVTMTLDDFILALAAQTGANPEQMRTAAETVIAAAKRETTKVM